MSARTLIRLLIAAVGLLGLWFVVTLIPRGSDGAEGGSDDWSGFFDGLSPATVTAVRIGGRDGERILARAGESWTIDGLPTDSATLDLRGGCTVARLVARNPDNHARMGLALDSAFSLSFEVIKESRTILIGNPGPSFTDSFVRRPDSDGAYLLTGDLRSHVTRSLSDWRDKRVVVIDTARVARIELSVPGDSYSLMRENSTWTLAGAAAAEQGAVQGVLQELATLRASGVIEEGDSLAVMPAAMSIAALAEAGDTLAVIRLGEGEADRWVRARGNDTVFRLPSFRVDRLVPSRERLEGE